MAKRGLYANIHAKRERIKAGSDEKMRKVGAPGAPSKQDFVDSAKTAKKPKKAMYGGKMKKDMKHGGKPHKEEMMYGGMMEKKKPMMKKGGKTKAGLKALAKERPDVVKNMGFDPMNLGHGGNVCKTRKKMSYGGMMKNYSSENKKYGGHMNMPNPRKPMGTK